MRWLGSITNATDMNLSKLRETVEDRGVWHATRKAPYTVYAVTRSQAWFNHWAIATSCRVIFSLCPVPAAGIRAVALPFPFFTYISPTYLKDSNHDVPAFASFLQPCGSYQCFLLSWVKCLYISQSWLFFHSALSPQLTCKLWVHEGLQLFSNKWTWGEAWIQFTAPQK